MQKLAVWHHHDTYTSALRQTIFRRVAFTGFVDSSIRFWPAGQERPERFWPAGTTKQDWLSIQKRVYHAKVTTREADNISRNTHIKNNNITPKKHHQPTSTSLSHQRADKLLTCSCGAVWLQVQQVASKADLCAVL